MTEWGKGQEKQKTEQCKKLVHACGQKHFAIDEMKRDSYICSIHLISNQGSIGEYLFLF